MGKRFRNLPFEVVEKPTQQTLDAAWRAAGGTPAPFKIVCRTCRRGPANGVEVKKMADESWICGEHL